MRCINYIHRVNAKTIMQLEMQKHENMAILVQYYIDSVLQNKKDCYSLLQVTLYYVSAIVLKGTFH